MKNYYLNRAQIDCIVDLLDEDIEQVGGDLNAGNLSEASSARLNAYLQTLTSCQITLRPFDGEECEED